MDFKFDNEGQSYSSDDAYEDLEKIKDILHEAKKKINKNKLEKTNIDLSININIEDNNSDDFK